MRRNTRSLIRGYDPITGRSNAYEWMYRLDAMNGSSRHGKHEPTRLDRLANRMALLVCAILLFTIGFQVMTTPADQIDWLSAAANLLAYDKPPF